MDKFLEIMLAIVAALILILPFTGRTFVNKGKSNFILRVTKFGWWFAAVTVFAVVLNMIMIIRKYDAFEGEKEAKNKAELTAEKRYSEYKVNESDMKSSITRLENRLKDMDSVMIKKGVKYDPVLKKITIETNVFHAERDINFLGSEKILLDNEKNEILNLIKVTNLKCINVNLDTKGNGQKFYNQLMKALKAAGHSPMGATSTYSNTSKGLTYWIEGDCINFRVGLFD